MSLPGIKITINTSGIGSVPHTADGVAGILLGGSLEMSEPAQIFSLKDAENLGITETTENHAWRQIKDFYEQTGEGAELWVKLFNGLNVKQSEAIENELPKLLDAAGGRIRIAATDIGASEAIETAIEKAQLVADTYAAKMMPVRVLVSTIQDATNPGGLLDLKTLTARNVAVVIAGLAPKLTLSAIGLALGRLASIPVQRNIGRVKDGAVLYSQAYMSSGVKVEEVPSMDAVHDKGYITWRKFVGRSGYFFNDDHTCVADSDDYSSLARGRVIDKAMILAYQTYMNEVNDEVSINQDGTLPASYVKALQAKIENVINQAMTSKGEISAVRATIDPTQNVLQTDELEVNLQVLPVGYTKYINVTLGMTNILNS